jgi:hypothetical protein
LQDALLGAPEHAPDIVHHDPAESAANANAELAVALPSSRVQGKIKPGSPGDEHGKNDGEQRSFTVELAHAQDADHDKRNQGPDDEEAADCPARVRRPADGQGARLVFANDDHPIPDAGQHGDHRGPPEPPKSRAHESAVNTQAGGRIQFAQKAQVHQLEEVEQPNPEDSGKHVNKT